MRFLEGGKTRSADATLRAATLQARLGRYRRPDKFKTSLDACDEAEYPEREPWSWSDTNGNPKGEKAIWCRDKEVERIEVLRFKTVMVLVWSARGWHGDLACKVLRDIT